MGILYKLKHRIINASEISKFEFYEETKISNILKIENGYDIICLQSANYIYYKHIKNDMIIKICVYEKDLSVV